MSGHHEHWGECDSCGWKTEALTEVDCWARVRGAGPFTPDDEKVWAWMCEVCRTSPAGTAYVYNWGEDKNASVLRMLAWQTNYLTERTVR
jgi:hypothetical protein